MKPVEIRPVPRYTRYRTRADEAGVLGPPATLHSPLCAAKDGTKKSEEPSATHAYPVFSLPAAWVPMNRREMLSLNASVFAPTVFTFNSSWQVDVIFPPLLLSLGSKSQELYETHLTVALDPPDGL